MRLDDIPGLKPGDRIEVEFGPGLGLNRQRGTVIASDAENRAWVDDSSKPPHDDQLNDILLGVGLIGDSGSKYTPTVRMDFQDEDWGMLDLIVEADSVRLLGAVDLLAELAVDESG